MSTVIIDLSIKELRGKSDYSNHVGSAFLAGLLFKSTAGVRPAFISGAIMASVVAGYGIWSRELSLSGLNISSIAQQPI